MFVQALYFKKYSTASDVWSYGVVMYEIWSIGHKPFEGHSNNKVCIKSITCYVCVSLCIYPFPKAMKLVERGYRLPPPPGCPKAMYELMINCW